MKYKIYQSYYKDSHVAFLNPEFVAFDNRTNPHPELREYYVALQVRDLAHRAGLDMWGILSPTWNRKLYGITASDIIKHIDSNPGYDVYFFDAFTEQMIRGYNVWEQGSWYHPDIVDVVEAGFTAMGLDLKYLHQPMGRDLVFSNCYCIGTRDFWDGYLDLVTKFLDSITNWSEQDQTKLFGPSQYGLDPDLWYFPFVQERLYSTFLLMQKSRFRVKPYHLNESYHAAQYKDLYTLKEQAISKGDPALLEQWRQQRMLIQDGPDWAKHWIKEFDPELSNVQN